MKLLSWMMQHKFRQSTVTADPPIKHNISIGKSCTSCFLGLAGHYSSFDGGDLTGLDDDDNDNYQDDLVEHFHGFLAIGTLGTEPSTPTFSISTVEYVVGMGEEETVNDDDDDDPEQGLGLEDGREASLRRSSCSLGGAERIIHCRTITLSEMAVESGPFQDASLSSSKKGQRTTLGDLFEKSNQMEENPVTVAKSNNFNKIKIAKKGSNKTGTNIMRKMSKLHNKILHIFNKKVHPEAAAKKHSKNEMMNSKNNNAHGMGTIINPRPFDEHMMIMYPHQQEDYSRQSSCGKNKTYLPFIGENRKDADVVNELWVKTDDDYLVLELSD